MAAENSPRRGIVRLHAVDGRSWLYRGLWLLSLFWLSSFWVAVLNCSYPFFLCVATLFWIHCCDLLRGRNNAKYIIITTTTMAFVFSSLSKPKDGEVKVEYFYGTLPSENVNADLS